MDLTLVANRDEEGKFVESPESLERKVISFRLPKSLYPKFLEAAKGRGKEVSVMAREVVEEWLKREADND